MQGYIKYLQARLSPTEKDPTGDGIDYHAEKARKTRSEANISEMEEAKMRGQLVDVTEVSDVLSAVVAEARTKLLNTTPTRIASRVKSVRKEVEIKAIVKDEITAAMREIAAADPVDLITNTE